MHEVRIASKNGCLIGYKRSVITYRQSFLRLSVFQRASTTKKDHICGNLSISVCAFLKI